MLNIPYGRHDITDEDILAVNEVLKSDYLTQGPCVPKFEVSVAEYSNVKNAVAVNSATSALHIACLALGVGKGDIVWTSPITFVASANCAIYCGAEVDFVDINPHTYNMCPNKLQIKLNEAKKIGRLPKVIIPVHMTGQSCDMEKIFALSKIYGFRIIEDASHAIGGRYKDSVIGSCIYSDITVFSFHPVKIITTGEGGMATTQDCNLAQKMRMLRSHGITNLKSEMFERPTSEIWNYQQLELGFNYRMTDIQAALGLSQLKRIDELVVIRNQLRERYDLLLGHLPVKVPLQDSMAYSSCHLYVVRVASDIRQKLYDSFYASGIKVNLHYIPVYRQPYYEKLGFVKGYCPEAEAYFSEAISIPLYPRMTEYQQDRIVKVLADSIKL